MITTEDTRTQYAVKGTMPKHGKLQLHVKTGHLRDTDREWMEGAVEEERYWQQEAYKITPDAVLVTRSWTGNGWTDWEPVTDDEPDAPKTRQPEDATTTAELQDALNPFTFWSGATPELAEQMRRVLAAAGKRPTPDRDHRVQIYAALDRKGEPIAWVVGDSQASHIIPFDEARTLLTNNWADLVRERPSFIPDW